MNARTRARLISAVCWAVVALIAGKLAGLVTASWWLVLAPIWLPYAVILLAAALGLALAVLS